MSSSHSAIVSDLFLNNVLTIVGVEEHGIERELGSDSLADIEKIEHLLN